MPDTRKTAIEILQNILEKKQFFKEAKNSVSAPENQDSAFLNMLVLTTLRRLVFIKKTLHKYAKKKLPAKAAYANYALFLGISELLFMNTPDYAVINSYVNLSKQQTDKFVAGFVNAVLRKIAADKDEILTEDSGEFFTSEFFKILNTGYGKKTVAKIQLSAQQEPPLDITVKQLPEIWAEKLGGTVLTNGSVRLKNNAKILELPGYDDGEWWVQDAAASLAVKALGKISGQRVLDLCAAPGGKTAQLIAAGAKTTALDISDKRLITLDENLNRLNFQTERTICADALEYLKNFDEEPYDIILLDAPCSATGTLRRHPETVHIKSSADIQKMAILQKQLLNLAGKALKRNGILLYCTCSISKIEGENQIAEFLKDNHNFKLLPIKNIGFKEAETPEGYIRTLPFHLAEQGGMDAFFIAKLQKEA